VVESGALSPPGAPADADRGRDPGDLAEAGVYATAAEGFDHGLVVLAMGESYCLVCADAGFRLLVEPAVLAAVRDQLACYDRESAGWPPRAAVEEAPPARRFEWFTPLLWALAVMTVFWCQGRWPGRLELAGALDPQAVFDRAEWWRPATALFLHTDLEHLVSNLVSGFFVFAALTATFGRRRGWLRLLLASVAGNIAVAGLNYPGPYRSLGASTAIFAALGLLTGRAVRRLHRPGPAHRWRGVLAPLAAGLALLALFGAGGPHTDIGAHVTGFASGLALGFTTRAAPPGKEGTAEPGI